MAVAAFSGTVVACTTRHQVTKPTTAYVTHFDANWILTLAIEDAEPGLPFTTAAEVAFAIHSPVQLLFDSATEAIGKRYRFTVDVDETTGPRWRSLLRT